MVAPKLYEYMYCEEKSDYRRIVMSTSLPSDAYDEVKKILTLAESCDSSTGVLRREGLEKARIDVHRKCR